MIDPEAIPQYTGNLAELEAAYGDLKSDASDIRDTGRDVHTRFQGLSAYYSAPEAEQLFATTKPVADRSDDFATGLETVSSALSGYATEIRPLVEKLKIEATNFVNSVKDDKDWEYDGDKVDEHNRIRDEITQTVAAFWAAERTCHNKITALWHGTRMVAGDGSDNKNQYGFDAADMKNAKLPWGDPVDEKHHWWEVGHWVKSFLWDGIVIDSVWGTIKGLGTLVGVNGWAAMGQAWKGLAQLTTGLVISSLPGAQALFWGLPDDKLPSWLRDSRKAMKETGKALVAWDEWGKNPARAAGAVTFNVLTAVFTGGEGAAAAGAGKAGAVARAASVAGKVGRVIDPMTYVAKGAGAGLSKIGDITAALKGVGRVEIPELPENALTLPEGAVRLPDGTVHLPEGAAIPEGAVRLPDGNVQLPAHDGPVLPEGATRLPTGEGAPARYLDPRGNILDEHGDVLQSAEDAPREPGDTEPKPPTGSDVPHTPTPAREPALVGAGGQTAEQAGEHVRLVDSVGHDLGDVGRAGDDAAVHAGGESVPRVHAGGDGLPGAGHAGDHLPGGHAGDHLPGGSAHEHGAGPSASHEAPSDHGSGSHTDGPGNSGHEGSRGGHEQPSVGGHVEGTATDGHEGAATGGGEGLHGSGTADAPDIGGMHEPAGWERPTEATGPMERGGQLEQQVRDQIRGTNVKPGDVGKIMQTLGDSPAGKEIADTIASGRFRNTEGFSTVVSNLSRPQDLSGCLEQIRLANRLHNSGLTDISFEVKQDGHTLRPGVITGPATDLDVMARDANGDVHGWQFKDMTGPDSTTKASKVVDKIYKSLDQLRDSHADVQTFVVDTKVPKAEIESQLGRLQKGFEQKEVQFVIRTPDGVVFVPRGGRFTPEGTL
ncbi:hypothetical protein ACWEWG_27390 [Streptomyces sp. NPDC003758]